MPRSRSKHKGDHIVANIYPIGMGKYSSYLGKNLLDMVFAVEGMQTRRISIISDSDSISLSLVKWCWTRRNFNFIDSTPAKDEFKKIVRKYKHDPAVQNLPKSLPRIKPTFQKPFYIHGRVFLANCYLIGLKCVIEIDSYNHNTEKQKQKDISRDSFFKKIGFNVIRISEKDAVNQEKVFELLKRIQTGEYWDK